MRENIAFAFLKLMHLFAPSPGQAALLDRSVIHIEEVICESYSPVIASCSLLATPMDTDISPETSRKPLGGEWVLGAMDVSD